MRLEWKGAAFKDKIVRAETRALEEAADDGAARVALTHPGWVNRSGDAQRSLRAEQVQRDPQGRLTARFGFHVPYGKFIARRDRALVQARNRAARSLTSRIADELRMDSPLAAKVAAGGNLTKLPGRAASDRADASAGRIPTGGDVSTR